MGDRGRRGRNKRNSSRNRRNAFSYGSSFSAEVDAAVSATILADADVTPEQTASSVVNPNRIPVSVPNSIPILPNSPSAMDSGYAVEHQFSRSQPPRDFFEGAYQTLEDDRYERDLETARRESRLFQTNSSANAGESSSNRQEREVEQSSSNSVESTPSEISDQFQYATYITSNAAPPPPSVVNEAPPPRSSARLPGPPGPGVSLLSTMLSRLPNGGRQEGPTQPIDIPAPRRNGLFPFPSALHRFYANARANAPERSPERVPESIPARVPERAPVPVQAPPTPEFVSNDAQESSLYLNEVHENFDIPDYNLPGDDRFPTAGQRVVNGDWTSGPVELITVGNRRFILPLRLLVGYHFWEIIFTLERPVQGWVLPNIDANIFGVLLECLLSSSGFHGFESGINLIMLTRALLLARQWDMIHEIHNLAASIRRYISCRILYRNPFVSDPIRPIDYTYLVYRSEEIYRTWQLGQSCEWVSENVVSQVDLVSLYVTTIPRNHWPTLTAFFSRDFRDLLDTSASFRQIPPEVSFREWWFRWFRLARFLNFDWMRDSQQVSDYLNGDNHAELQGDALAEFEAARARGNAFQDAWREYEAAETFSDHEAARARGGLMTPPNGPDSPAESASPEQSPAGSEYDDSEGSATHEQSSDGSEDDDDDEDVANIQQYIADFRYNNSERSASPHPSAPVEYDNEDENFIPEDDEFYQHYLNNGFTF